MSAKHLRSRAHCRCAHARACRRLLVVARREQRRDSGRRQCPADESAARPYPALYGRAGRLSPEGRGAGTVDFDNDQATSVVSPFTGPVTRIFVALGSRSPKASRSRWSSPPITPLRSAPIARPSLPPPTRDRLATADRDLAAHNGISEREAAQAQTDAASAEADRDAALQTLISMGVDRGTIARAWRAIRRPGFPGSFAHRSPASSSTNRSRRASCCRLAPPPAFTVANLSQVWVLAQIAPSDLSSVGVAALRQSILATEPGRSTAPSRISARASIRTPARSSRGSSLPIPPTFSRSRCTSTSRSNPDASAPGCWCRSPRCFATIENLPFVYIALPDGSFARRHVTLGYRDSQNYDVTSGLASGDRIVAERRDFPPVHAEPMNEDPAEPPRTGSSFINRIVALSLEQRILVAFLTVLLIAAGVRAWDAAAGRRLSRPVAADGLDHRPMARPLGGRGGKADHRSDRARNERHSQRRITSARSRSTPCPSVDITFDQDTDRNFARQQVFNRLADLDLPSGVTPDVEPLTSPSGLIYRYTLQSPDREPHRRAAPRPKGNRPPRAEPAPPVHGAKLHAHASAYKCSARAAASA